MRTLTPRPTAHPTDGNDDGGKDYARANNDDLNIDTGLLQSASCSSDVPLRSSPVVVRVSPEGQVCR